MSTSRFSFLFWSASVLLFGIPAHAAFPGQNGKIVFQSDSSGSWQLYTIDADGSNLTQVTQMPPTEDDLWVPSFSPDGKQIAFCYGSGSSFDTLVSEIYVINADGTGLKQLTNDGVFACSPRWSPDGEQLIFSETFAPTGQAVIMAMRSDGTGERTILTTGEFRFWNSFGPATFTPNGKKIVFESQFGGLVSAAWIMNSDGTHKRRLTAAPLEAFPLDVSPDGTQILFANHGNVSLPNSAFFMDLDGKNIHRLTHLDNVHEAGWSYSPDGRKILLISDRLNSAFIFDLFTMNADGSDIKRIAAAASCPTDPGGNCGTGNWGPKPK
jgi:Tol biopolymer transport system component